jgi:hypothetical protein
MKLTLGQICGIGTAIEQFVSATYYPTAVVYRLVELDEKLQAAYKTVDLKRGAILEKYNYDGYTIPYGANREWIEAQREELDIDAAPITIAVQTGFQIPFSAAKALKPVLIFQEQAS